MVVGAEPKARRIIGDCRKMASDVQTFTGHFPPRGGACGTIGLVSPIPPLIMAGVLVYATAGHPDASIAGVA